MKYRIIYLLLLSAQVSFAQIFTVRKISTNDDAYQFPLIESSQRPGIAKKMNLSIQKDLGANPTLKNPFDSISGEDEYYFEVNGINERILSIVVTGSHTGCGLHITRNDYNFDSRTGALIDFNQVFGADGTVKLNKALYKSWKAKLKGAVSDQSRGEEYKACLAEAENITELSGGRTIITDQGVKIWAGSCLEGTTYDFEADVSAGPHDFSFGQLLPMLTPYGYSLFAERSSGPVQSLLRGTIDNKYAISLTLLPGKEGSAPGTIGGMIVYDRIDQPINVSGTMDGNKFIFHELDDSNNPLSDIEVTWDGAKLTGTFTNLKSKKQMPFLAAMVGGK